MNKIEKRLNDFYYKLAKNEQKVFYKIDEEQIYLSDSYIISIMNKESNLLNYDKMINAELDKFINNINIEDYKPVKDFYVKENLVYLLNDNLKVCIDKKYMKLYENLDIYIIDEIKPVIFKLEDNIIGFVLPIKEY